MKLDECKVGMRVRHKYGWRGQVLRHGSTPGFHTVIVRDDGFYYHEVAVELLEPERYPVEEILEATLDAFAKSK